MRSLKILLFIILTGCAISAQPVDVKFGIDVLVQRNFDLLEGKNIGLFVNIASQSSENIPTLDILSKQTNLNIKAVFVPEHGYYTTVPAGKIVEDSEINGLKVYSLYNASKKPESGILSELDIIVADIQDIGIRSYTYISTLYNLMEACSDAGIELLVLDRPNPLGGEVVDGNTVEPEWQSFVSKIPVSYIHGCTIGELAYMINEEGWLPQKKYCQLSILKMQNWERWMHWEDVVTKWTPTSPHIPTVDAIRGMATLGAFGELGIMSIGIGTTLPFQYIGSPMMNSDSLIEHYKQLDIHGLELLKINYQPFYGMYSGKKVNGCLLRFYNCCNLKPYSTGFEIFFILRKLYPGIFKSEDTKVINMFKKVTGTDDIYDALISNKNENYIRELLKRGHDEYLNIREKYLLY